MTYKVKVSDASEVQSLAIVDASEIKNIIKAYRSIRIFKLFFSKEMKMLEAFYKKLTKTSGRLSDEEQLALVLMLKDFDRNLNLERATRDAIFPLMSKLENFITLLKLAPHNRSLSFLFNWDSNKANIMVIAYRILSSKSKVNLKLKSHITLLNKFPQDAIDLANTLMGMPFCERENFCQHLIASEKSLSEAIAEYKEEFKRSTVESKEPSVPFYPCKSKKKSIGEIEAEKNSEERKRLRALNKKFKSTDELLMREKIGEVDSVSILKKGQLLSVTTDHLDLYHHSAINKAFLAGGGTMEVKRFDMRSSPELERRIEVLNEAKRARENARIVQERIEGKSFQGRLQELPDEKRMGAELQDKIGAAIECARKRKEDRIHFFTQSSPELVVDKPIHSAHGL